MAITGVTNTTVVADAILTETIETSIKFAVQAPYLFRDVAYIPPTLRSTKRWSVPNYARLAASGAYTESDTVTAQALTPTAVDVDTALYATGAFLSDWAEALAVQPMIPATVQALMDAVDLRLETDVLGLVSSMSNSIGSNAVTNNADNFVLATSTFRAQAKASTRMPLMVLSESAKRDLNADLMSNGGGVYGSLIGVQLHQAVAEAQMGQWVPFGGYMIASTSAVPTVSSGKGNFIVHMGGANESALGLAFSMDPRINPGRKEEAVGLYLIAAHAHGAGIIDQSRALRFITKA
jgi:hypothetical protein